jgi:hypothetical protein
MITRACRGRVQQCSASLTGLTSLRFLEESDWDPEPPQLWQAQFASALTALSSLQHMEMQRIWIGPVASALGQMTSLTKLELTRQQPRLSPRLRLPSVQVLCINAAELYSLLFLEAPNLQHLQGYSPGALSAPFSLLLPFDQVPRQAALIEALHPPGDLGPF